MALLDKYSRVTEDIPCPKCGRPDWCLTRNDGRTCICTREPSGKVYGDAGWLHYLPDGVVTPVSQPAKPKVYLSSQQVSEYLVSITNDYNDSMLPRQAKLLELSAPSLRTMRASYDDERAVVVFPMFDAAGKPVGCRFRRSDGRKFSLTGGREGLFISRGFTPRKTLFIAEGPTDSAALVECGIGNVIGRPNCSGGSSYILTILSEYKTTEIIIISDPDEPGIDGATALADKLPNPTIVLSGPADIRKYVSKTKLKSEAKACILEGVDSEECSLWKTIYRNRAGKCHRYRILI